MPNVSLIPVTLAVSFLFNALGALGDELNAQFTTAVRPFIQSYCVGCHSGEKPKARFDISPYRTLGDVTSDLGHWEIILDYLQKEEMPPEDAEKHPSAAERQAIIDWIVAIQDREATRNAGDPGEVLARRLSNAEYDYTIRDLTGVDLRPAREFPIDPANEAGFDNSGESLSLSPALLKKYIEAARGVSEHLVLKPEGFDFAPHPAATDTDRDKYCVKRIIEFYKSQPTDYADYFEAAWKFKHRAALSEPGVTLEQIADEAGVSAKYLKTVFDLLEGQEFEAGPVASLRELWRDLPAPNEPEDALRNGIDHMRDFVILLRPKLSRKFPHLRVRGIHNGSQTLVLWRNRQRAEHRMTLHQEALISPGNLSNADGEADEPDPRLLLPEDPEQQTRVIAAFEKFCAVFPDTFYVSERGREFLDREPSKMTGEKGRLLSAGFHSMMGYFRDDAPLYDLILDEAAQEKLDALWRELDFIAFAPMRQHTGFVWFERTDSRFMRDPEFDFARAEDKDVTSEEKIKRLAEIYLAKAIDSGAGEVEAKAIADHFDNINGSVRWVESARLAAEPSHLEALLNFAERAYRRPLEQAEKSDALEFYNSLRNAEGMDHEEAMRDSIVSILVSPHFWYRIDIPAETPGVHPLNDYELASRLSYFLWSSMPDEELLERAAAGVLHEPGVLMNQAKRMLMDPRIRRLAVEFGANWLDFRQFESHNSVDRERFPSFTTELRQAMFDEPVRFFADVAAGNRSILDFLYADDTFVNRPLAEHYGISVESNFDEWIRVEQSSRYGRGGLLPMAVFQTINAPGLRTSPVKRGYWVVRRLLGEHIPPPPPNVPELPEDESLTDLHLREMLARHRQDKSCAGCHQRFDGIGLAFEGFGPVGERRAIDLAGRPIDNAAVFPGGSEGAGVEGLKHYLRDHRQEEFVHNLSEKLFAYALGRTLIPSDKAAIEEMKERLVENDYRFNSLIESIVTSKQFLNKRGRINLTSHSSP